MIREGDSSAAALLQNDKHGKLNDKGRKISRSEAEAEVVADACEMLLRDSKTVQALVAEHRSLGEKIADWLQKFIAKVKAIFGDAEHVEARAVMEQLDRAQAIWDRALAAAVETHDQIGNEKTATEGGVQYMAREFTDERNVVGFRDHAAIRNAIEKTSAEIIKNGDVVHIPADLIASEENGTDWKDYKAARMRVQEILKTVLDVDVRLGADGISLTARLTNEGLDHASKKGNTAKKAAIFDKFLELAGKSAYSFSVEHEGTHSKASNNITQQALWDSFISVAEHKGASFPVVFEVRSIDSDLRGQIRDAWTGREVDSIRGAGTQENPANGHPSYDGQSTSVSNITDEPAKSNPSEQNNSEQRSDRDSTGRELTEGQQEYFKDSKIRDEDGNLITLYHGTTYFGEITKFKHGKTGWLGPGIYMTSRESDAKRYADAMGPGNGWIYEVYANVTNPLVVTSGNPVPEILRAAYGKDSVYQSRSAKQTNDPNIITAADNKKLQAKGYDGIRWNYGRSTEVSAFAQNQIKRTDNANPTENPDIRYSEREGGELTDA